MTSPRHIGEPANELLSRLEKLQKTVQERHAKRVESAALPGETFDQAEARLKREDEERQEQEQRAKELLAKGAAGKSIVRKAPKGDEQKDFFVPTLYDVGARDT
ncbi:replication protein RepA, partial [Proteus mirabilis]|nr:replication protein RepA [Proteus mirabilis]